MINEVTHICLILGVDQYYTGEVFSLLSLAMVLLIGARWTLVKSDSEMGVTMSKLDIHATKDF